MNNYKTLTFCLLVLTSQAVKTKCSEKNPHFSEQPLQFFENISFNFSSINTTKKFNAAAEKLPEKKLAMLQLHAIYVMP